MHHVPRARRKVAVANLLSLIIALVVVADSPARAAIKAQPSGTGRIAGRVTDAPQAGVSGITVTIAPYSVLSPNDANIGKPFALDGDRRSVVTDGEGRFVFEGLRSDKTYLVSAHAPGRRTVERWDLNVKDGDTVSIDLPLSAPCSMHLDSVSEGPLSQLLRADAVLHLRIPENGVGRLIQWTWPSRELPGFACEEWNDAPATVLGVARLGAQWAGSSEIPITAEKQLEAGQEYLAVLNYDSKRERFQANIMIAGSEVSTWSNPALGVREGMSIERALRALRETAARHSQYRTYEDLRSTAPLESLRYRTGWTLIGVLRSGDVWDVEEGKRFEFATATPPDQVIPRVNDRITMTRDSGISILDYGSRGESLRDVSPTTRRYGFEDITSSTGARAQAGHSYRVADVRVERRSGEDYRTVWVRLVAD